ncbi:hypothetical protein ACG74X_10165 [Marivita sp. S0852]|uniref:hypothetical protein n=1 Tax=Marivita sp. S0852 TaxID=3373893 RepID=UPI0039821946
MTSTLIARLICRALAYVFYTEQRVVVRKKIGTLAGRRIMSEETRHSRYIDSANVLGALFLLAFCVDLLAEHLTGGAVVACWLNAAPLFCDTSADLLP